MYRMRHIAVSETGSIFLTAEFEHKVFAWDLTKFEKVSEFNTYLDFGGNRLAISEDGSKCIAAAYTRYGICMYDILTGKLLWHRKDQKKAQNVKFNPENTEIYVGTESKPLVILNSLDGTDITKLDSITNVYFNNYGYQNLLLKGSNTILFDKNEIVSPTFAFLDARTASSGFAVSAVGSNLMFYGYSDLNKFWEVASEGQEHFVNIGYCENSDIINAILYKYSDQRIPPYHVLYGIKAVDGEIIYKFGLPSESCEFKFAQNGSKLICSSGEIFNLTYNTPQLIYKFEWD